LRDERALMGVYGVLCVRLIIPWTTTSMGL